MPNDHFKILRPTGSHWQEATCKEVDCTQQERGWTTLIDETTTDGQARAHYIRTQSGRHFTERREGGALRSPSAGDGFTAFDFPSGQKCFRTHQRPLERLAIPKINGRTVEGVEWLDSFNERSYEINKRRK